MKPNRYIFALVLIFLFLAVVFTITLKVSTIYLALMTIAPALPVILLLVRRAKLFHAKETYD
jgi:uncharacterized membrane protein AbrB (regulator of aidB expression)